jgi:hypothetical protein
VTVDREPRPQALEVVGLDEGPVLNPGAARVLLRLLVNVARARAREGSVRAEDEGGDEAA